MMPIEDVIDVGSMYDNKYWLRYLEMLLSMVIGGDAIEAQRHVSPQILGPGGTQWSVPPPILAVM